MRDHFPGVEYDPSRAGSDACEITFSSLGGWEGILGTRSFDGLCAMNQIERSLAFVTLTSGPNGVHKPHSNRKHSELLIVTQQLKAKVQRANGADIPGDPRIVALWEQGKKSGQDKIMSLGCTKAPRSPNDDWFLFTGKGFFNKYRARGWQDDVFDQVPNGHEDDSDDDGGDDGGGAADSAVRDKIRGVNHDGEGDDDDEDVLFKYCHDEADDSDGDYHHQDRKRTAWADV